jgi:DNA (cytosine-5)-methyltransferase 1
MKKNNGPWLLSDLAAVKTNGLTVFSCFHCGGGSSMGYRLAGFNVLGGIEIDPEMMALYRINHKPKYSYKMSVQEFNKLDLNKLPDELKELDILDGSPPCSSFSMSGRREAKWGNEHYFREGQKKQKLDDLFFEFIKIAKRLQPKIVIAENVKGLIAGNARGYVKEIFIAFKEAGYETQLFLFNANRMGVPQSRQRVFFLARRKDQNLPKIKPNFQEAPIAIGKVLSDPDIETHTARICTPAQKKWWVLTKPGDSFAKVHPKGSWFNASKLDPRKPCCTLAAAGGGGRPYHWAVPRHLSIGELIRVQSFPEDYNFLKSKPGYVMGMSVPPFMIQRVALEIAKQWFR